MIITIRIRIVGSYITLMYVIFDTPLLAPQ